MNGTDPRRGLPAVDRLLAHPRVEASRGPWSRRTVLAVARQEIERARAAVAGGATPPDLDQLAVAVLVRLEALARPRPRRVINATGVVIHTNLGRAPLGRGVLEAAAAGVESYSDLEFDLAGGVRGSRQVHVGEFFALLFPGQAALVVNNNAAAVLLALNTLALGREVIVSRGELVEIGGSFRIPEVLERSGARLVEGGATNRTHASDYEQAFVSATALILKVWPSNYRVVGFTSEVRVAELAALGRARGVPVVVDQGCGRLFRDGPGPASEESVEELLAEGASLVCFSGDKLLGGPQCGVILGAPDLVARCGKNPLARALRPDKLTLAALAATCGAWLKEDPRADLPALRMLEATPDDLRRTARRLAAQVRKLAPHARVDVVGGVSRVGGGAAPEEDLPTFLVAVSAPDVSDEEILARLRAGDPPVVARAQDGAVLVDPRTLLLGEDREVARALAAALTPGARTGSSP